MKREFSIRFILVTIAVAIAIFAFTQLFESYTHPHIWYIFAYCASLSFLSFLLTARGMQSQDFANYGMASTGLRLFLSVGVIVTYLMKVGESPLLFAVTFFILYFFYMGFEILALLANLRQNSEQVDNDE
ncbi:MAG: hypothetical protein JJT94_12845 [Bernardetiaceae bacterium]|nr:hypothetical protein [Bernardetiaceae bacterium]